MEHVPHVQSTVLLAIVQLPVLIVGKGTIPQTQQQLLVVRVLLLTVSLVIKLDTATNVVLIPIWIVRATVLGALTPAMSAIVQYVETAYLATIWII